jgi:hypothetical protein
MFESLVKRLGTQDETIQRLTDAQRRLSAELHESLWLSSIGQHPGEAANRRVIPIRVYLSDNPDDTSLWVQTALGGLLQVIGFEFCDVLGEESGSWAKSWFAKTKEVVTAPEVEHRLKNIERAIELRGLGLPQAEIDHKQASAVATLIKSVERVENAAMQVGSLLVVKIGANVQVHTMTQQELWHVEKNRHLLKSPSDLIDKLRLAQANDSAAQADGQQKKISPRLTRKIRLPNRGQKGWASCK